MMISHWVILRTRNVWDESCTENSSTCFMVNDVPPPPPAPENRALYGIMWKRTVEPDRSQMTIEYGAETLPCACWMTKAQMNIHPLSIYYVLFNNCLILADVVKCFRATKIEKPRNDMSVITICLAEFYVWWRPWESERLNAASGTFHEDLRKFYCWRGRKCAIKSLLCDTHYFYLVDSDM
jgi:hypothetical protein